LEKPTTHYQQGTKTMSEKVQIGSLTCTPIHESFGAVVEGVDFSHLPLPDNVVEDIKKVQQKYAVTVYYDTGLVDATHVQFCRQLGGLVLAPQFKTGKPRYDFPYLFDAGNVLADGSLVEKDTRRWHFNRGNALWHTDLSYDQHRSKYSLLLSHIVPKDGGNTDYADVRAAYRDLPQSKKDEIEDLVLEHDIWHSRFLAAPQEFATITEEEKAVKQPAYHKLVQVDEEDNKTLFLAAHARRVVGWPLEKGQALIKELTEFCTQPQYVTSIKWKAPHQIVFWDNRITLHRATPFSELMEKRDMRRVSVLDDSPTSHGVPDALEREMNGTLPAA